MRLVDDARHVTAHKVEDVEVRTKDGDEGTITIMQCDVCEQTHEYFFAPYARCPHCGIEIRVRRGPIRGKRLL